MIGKEILNYRIIGIVGQGGMGTVYLAINKFIKEQKVAIKVINHDMLNEFTRTKLEQEAHRLASLDHPNIVHLVNFHKDSEGNVYLIMEYAEGISIEKYLRDVNGLVVEERICPIFEPILDGIGYAHRHKSPNGDNDPIIHCDIKPANIVITPDENPKIKILDFGKKWNILDNVGNNPEDFGFAGILRTGTLPDRRQRKNPTDAAFR